MTCRRRRQLRADRRRRARAPVQCSRRGAALRRTALALTAAAVLAACGGTSNDTTTQTQQAAQQSQAQFPRTISHDKGSTEIPAQPRLIVALDNSLVEAVVLLDRPLVCGISSYRDQTGFPPWLGHAVKDTEDVRPLESPDLEAIATLEPDVIVLATVRHDALYDSTLVGMLLGGASPWAAAGVRCSSSSRCWPSRPPPSWSQ